MPTFSISTVKARNQFSTILNRAAFGKERVVLTRRNRAIAAVVPIEDMEHLEALEDRLDLEDARRSLAKARKGKSVRWTELKRTLK